MKKGPEKDLLERYVDRALKAGSQLGLSGPELRDWSESRADSVSLRKQEEAVQIVSALKPGAFLIVLDENGKDISSVQFAERISTAMDNGIPELALAIGGPDGHGEGVLNRADLVLRMGSMTWPHQLARIMAGEQIYRAITILSGHPYHRM